MMHIWLLFEISGVGWGKGANLSWTEMKDIRKHGDVSSLTAVFVCKSLICMRRNITHAVHSVQISYGTLFNLWRMKSCRCIMRGKLFISALSCPQTLVNLGGVGGGQSERREVEAAGDVNFFENRRACFLAAEINFSRCFLCKCK